LNINISTEQPPPYKLPLSFLPHELLFDYELTTLKRIHHREYINEISFISDVIPTKLTKVHEGRLVSTARALRKLAMANFATKIVRLNAVTEHVGRNTHVATLASWRDPGFEADFTQNLTRGKGESRARTAIKLLTFLCDGSPVGRPVFQEILIIEAPERVDRSQ
jgi:hypothetical protein